MGKLNKTMGLARPWDREHAQRLLAALQVES